MPVVDVFQDRLEEKSLSTADAGYHSEANLKQLHGQGIAALIADGLMRRCDERFREQAKHTAKPDPLANKKPVIKPAVSSKFRPVDFQHDAMTNSCL